MNLEETIRAIETHKERLCNRCPMKLDEPRCWDRLLNEAYSQLVVSRNEIEKLKLPPEPNPVIPWDELVTMRRKAVWIEQVDRRRRSYWGIILRLYSEPDPKRMSIWRAGYPGGLEDKLMCKVDYADNG